MKWGGGREPKVSRTLAVVLLIFIIGFCALFGGCALINTGFSLREPQTVTVVDRKMYTNIYNTEYYLGIKTDSGNCAWCVVSENIYEDTRIGDRIRARSDPGNAIWQWSDPVQQ